MEELHRMHLRGVHRGAFRKLRSKLPLRVEDEIRRGLSFDPGQRPPDVEVFGNRLGEFLGADKAPVRRRMLLLALLAIAVIVTGIRRCRRRWNLASNRGS
jgi:hypothetical protein